VAMQLRAERGIARPKPPGRAVTAISTLRIRRTMTGFVPHGYLTLRQALDRVAQSLFGDEWQGTVLSDGEQAALVRQRQAVKLLRAYSTSGRVARSGSASSRRPDRQELEDKAADTPETKAAQAKLKRRDNLRTRATEPLQQALFAGEVSAFVLSEGGSKSDVPVRVWGSADAARVFDTGKAAVSIRGYSYGSSGMLEGRVLVQEASLESWLTPAEPRRAPTTAASAADATLEETESPDPYKTGLPGRPSIAHLIEREFERRVEAGIALRVLAREAGELRAWAIEQHPDAPPPTEKTIANQIRELHRRYVEMTRK
jgi:hypothetical protein